MLNMHEGFEAVSIDLSYLTIHSWIFLQYKILSKLWIMMYQ